MKNKKVVVGLLIVVALAAGLISGCETLKNAFCSPTAEQVMAAGERLAQASDTLTYLEGLSPSPAVTAAKAALQIAIPILRQIKDGICVSAAEEANANQAVNSTYAYAVKMGFKAK